MSFITLFLPGDNIE